MGNPEVWIHFESLLQLDNGFVIAPQESQTLSNTSIETGGCRIKSECLPEVGHTRFTSATPAQIHSIPFMPRRQIRIELQCSFEVLFSFRTTALMRCSAPQRRMWFGEAWIERQGLFGCSSKFGVAFRVQIAFSAAHQVIVSQPSVGQSILRIECNSLLEVLQGRFVTGRGSFVQKKGPSEIGFLRGWGHWPQPGELFFALRSELRMHFAGNIMGDGALQSQRVAQVAFVLLGPQVSVVGNANQLCRDSYFAAGSGYCAFKDGVDPQFMGDLPQRLAGGLVLHDRRT